MSGAGSVVMDSVTFVHKLVIYCGCTDMNGIFFTASVRLLTLNSL